MNSVVIVSFVAFLVAAGAVAGLIVVLRSRPEEQSVVVPPQSSASALLSDINESLNTELAATRQQVIDCRTHSMYLEAELRRYREMGE